MALPCRRLYDLVKLAHRKGRDTMKSKSNLAYLAGIASALGLAVLVVLINMVVGFIGSEDNPANRMYLGVLATLLIGSLIARFRARGMSYALFATALAHAIVAVIALVAVEHDSVLRVFVFNMVFVALWVGSALLFRYAD